MPVQRAENWFALTPGPGESAPCEIDLFHALEHRSAGKRNVVEIPAQEPRAGIWSRARGRRFLAADLRDIGDEVCELGGGHADAVVCADRIGDRRGRAAVQVGGRRPDVAQRRNVDAGQRTAEAVAAAAVDRADILRIVAGAVGEGGAAMAAGAILRLETAGARRRRRPSGCRRDCDAGSRRSVPSEAT